MNTQMKNFIPFTFIIVAILGCVKPNVKQFYLLNYTVGELENRSQEQPHNCTIRLRPFEIEKAYGKSNIIYRKSPYELEYYGFEHWAVKPKDMMTDIVFSHLETIKLVDNVVIRLDEKGQPDFELSGLILAIEEYDSDDIWFAHLAIRMNFTRLSDGKIIYSKMFSKRRVVTSKTPLQVVKTLSELTDFFVSNLMIDLDKELAKELNTKGKGNENFKE